MVPFKRPAFPHRLNSDGSIDSICPKCFKTVGTADLEAKLHLLESTHVCPRSQSSYVVQFEDWDSKTREDRLSSPD
jgi:hypothetical protein